MLSMATDYEPGIHDFKSMADMMNGVGNPQRYLKAIADHGFSHVHWCHHWSGDFMYDEHEMAHIGRLLDEYGLQVADVHGSEGREKFWYSPQEYARLAGVDLVKNRVDFCARFGGDAVVMHAYPLPTDPEMAAFIWGQLCKTLDALEPYCVERGVKIAIENLIDFQGVKFDGVLVSEARDNWPLLARLFDRYSAEFLGLCYDSGHAHLGYDRMDGLENCLDRLCVLHLHGNNGTADQHRNMFVNDLNWDRMAQLIAKSVYNKPISLEVYRGELEPDETTFLQIAFETGNQFSQMVEDYR